MLCRSYLLFVTGTPPDKRRTLAHRRVRDPSRSGPLRCTMRGGVLQWVARCITGFARYKTLAFYNGALRCRTRVLYNRGGAFYNTRVVQRGGAFYNTCPRCTIRERVVQHPRAYCTTAPERSTIDIRALQNTAAPVLKHAYCRTHGVVVQWSPF